MNPPIATYAQLKKQLEQLSKQADAAFQAEKAVTLAKIREAVTAFALKAEDIFETAVKALKPAATKKAAPKRMKPTGAGQAKYRDPKTGAEWTRFGRAPAWLASAKDRNKFLIAQQPTPEATPAVKAPVQAAAKAAVKAKKTVAKKATAAPKAKTAAPKTAKTKAAPAKVATVAKTVKKVATKAAPVAAKSISQALAKKAVAKTAPAKKATKVATKPAVKAVAPASRRFLGFGSGAMSEAVPHDVAVR